MFGNHRQRRVKDNTPKPVKPVHPNIQALFHDLYRVRMYQMEVQSIEEQRAMGTISTGDRKLDNAMATSSIYLYITINDMVEYYRQGSPFFLTNQDDSKKIFEAVTNHTGVWRKALQFAMNMGRSPVQDLIDMENFASTIYDKAKFEYVKPPSEIHATGSLANFLYSGSVLRGLSYDANNKQRESTRESNVTDPKTKKHNPDISVFRDALMLTLQRERE